MDQVKPPTDSLYKFVAIFGLVLFLWSYYAADKFIDDHMDSVASYGEHVDDHDGLKYKVIEDAINGDTDKLDPFIQSLPISERAPFLKMYLQASKLTPTIANIHIGRNAGLLMIILGFFLWYYRVQRHLDAILYRQAVFGVKPGRSLPSD